MARIVVVGGGLIGLAAAMMLAKDGCEVTPVVTCCAPWPEPTARDRRRAAGTTGAGGRPGRITKGRGTAARWPLSENGRRISPGRFRRPATAVTPLE